MNSYPNYCFGCKSFINRQPDQTKFCAPLIAIVKGYIQECPCANCLIKMTCIESCQTFEVIYNNVKTRYAANDLREIMKDFPDKPFLLSKYPIF